MKNIKLVIEYDGTRYNGWQAQKNGLGIQTVITKAIETVTGEEIQLNGSGRTDAGVHAYGQVANFHTCSSVPGERFMFALNSLLPEDIAIVQSEEVDDGFHARFNAVGKTYRYLLWNSNRPNALLANRAYHVAPALAVEAMGEAAQLFVGEHDFAAFRAQGGSAKTSVRTIYSATVQRETGSYGGGNLIFVELHGNGFLYNMVRIIAGTLVEIGLGKKSSVDILKGFETLDRTMTGQTLPPYGLYLKQVFY